MALHFQQTPPISPPPSGGPPGSETSAEHLLGALDVAARKFAAAERANILPLALQEFLALCRARRGLVLTRSEGAAAYTVAVRQHLSQEMAERIPREPRFWGAPSPGVLFGPVDQGSRDASGEQQASETVAAFLADVGASWYAWLPLALPKGAETLLVALGDGGPPTPVERGRVSLAGVVLSDLVAAALERAELRHMLVSEEHTRDEFIGLASHELQSPLTVIKGYSQLLLRQARRGDHTGAVNLSGLEAISQQVSRMSNLVGELLDFSRIERGTLEVAPQPIDVVALTRQVVEQRQRALPDMNFFLTTREPELIALADRTRLEQVLGYLLDNAARFGQEEGVVEVIVQRVSAAPLPSLLSTASAEVAEAAAQDEVALISVRDYGPGLPHEESEKLFTAFYRGPEHSLQSQLAGLGLGLYVSRYLVARQNGYLWAEFPTTEHATGSIFYLGLPLPRAS
jgi:signal transduction histidine kinase